MGKVGREEKHCRFLSASIEAVPSELLPNPGCPPFPVVALIVAEHEIVTVQIVDDAVNAAVAINVLHLRAVAHGLALVRLVEAAKTLVNPLTVVTTLAGTDCERAWLTIRRSDSLRSFARLNKSYRSDCMGLNASTRILKS